MAVGISAASSDSEQVFDVEMKPLKVRDADGCKQIERSMAVG
jgi:hypothetical protein